MAKVTISEVEVLNSECGFADPFRFKIRFNCIEDLQEDLDWKVLYVGSANSCEFDQELDELSTGPIPVGTHEFELSTDGPDPSKFQPPKLLVSRLSSSLVAIEIKSLSELATTLIMSTVMKRCAKTLQMSPKLTSYVELSALTLESPGCR